MILSAAFSPSARPLARGSVGSCRGRLGRWLLVAGCAGWMVTFSYAQENELDVGVRSTVVDKPAGKAKAQAAPVHGKVYAIFAVQLIKSEDKLVKPVDATRLASLAVRELDAHGFTRVLKGQKPDILITLLYGRGWLRNPYMLGATVETPGSAMGVDAPAVSLTGISTQFFRETGIGYEAKLQKAQYEKLCIRITAWDASDPKAKPRQLWHTTMIVDDPDHRDLNSVADEMLAAGAPYFGREITEEEIEVVTPLRAGRVNVGTPEMVDDPLKPREK